MLELPGQMQVTLVGFYGEKPAELAQLITYLQDMLASALGSAFRPYQLEQVHGTLVGLEGHRVGTAIQNSNSGLQVDPSRVLSFIRSDHFPLIQVRVGGYQHYKEFPFKSRGMHPYVRSFSVQGEIAVAMGWPVNSGFPNSLDDLRWHFASMLNVRHKWHKQAGDCDNDFFFVLGRVDCRHMDAIRLQGVMEQARLSMAGLDGVIATISANTLRLVAYLDPQLPMETSSWFAVKDPALTAERWLALYPSSASSEKAEGHDEPRKPTITITQNKIGGFEPRWASFRGFSVLFDNPGVPISHADGLFRIMCSPEAAGELDLYFKLAKTIDEIGRDSLFATYLFCPLPSSSYHVTVWDGINVDNESKLLASLHVEWSHFLRGLPNTLQDPPKTMSIVGESSLLNGAFGDISFRFDKLTIWGKQVLVARLAPAGEPSAQRFSEVSEARALLGRRAKSDLGIDTTETYSPHVTLGYFANLDHGELAQSQMSEWTAHFRKNLEDSVLTLSSMAVYGFTDMTNFYRM